MYLKKGCVAHVGNITVPSSYRGVLIISFTREACKHANKRTLLFLFRWIRCITGLPQVRRRVKDILDVTVSEAEHMDN